MELSVGILIIGSLLWETKPHRHVWRNRRLDMDKSRQTQTCVRAPIRYGRKSESRCDTYTMVFSLDCENGKWGQAVAVACSRSANSARKLIEEAKELWRAEQADARAPAYPLGGSWGCVGLLENPTGQRMPNSWLQEWKSTVARGRQPPGGLRHAENEKPAVDLDHVLQIKWPVAVDGTNLLDSFDVLLATATNPVLAGGQYATPQIVAKAWNEGDPKWCEYFWKNRKHRIFTFEDNLIEPLLDPGHHLKV